MRLTYEEMAIQYPNQWLELKNPIYIKDVILAKTVAQIVRFGYNNSTKEGVVVCQSVQQSLKIILENI